MTTHEVRKMLLAAALGLAVPLALTGLLAATPADAPAVPKPRLIVFGDSDFASNSQIANAGNATLLADTFNWLVARQQALGIAAKTPEQVRLTLGAGQLSAIFWFVVGILPLVSVVAGVAVYLRRRR